MEVGDPGRKRGVKRKERKESGREELTGWEMGKQCLGRYMEEVKAIRL